VTGWAEQPGQQEGEQVSDEVVVWRSAERFTSQGDGTTSRRLLSFGAHYDAARISIGPLVAYNDETVMPGAGFDDHVHRDVEIVTWVVEGRLSHRDSTGHVGILTPGTAQRLTAGAGVTHAEVNADDQPGAEEPVRFIQMWLRADGANATSSYAERPLDPAALAGRLVVAASGDPQLRDIAGVSLAQSGATLYASRLAPAVRRALPVAPLVHVFVVKGDVTLSASAGGPLADDIADVTLELGDSATITGAADDSHMITVSAKEPSEILVWTFSG
jgi:redox-sensitive bicupin YhaK (pirin superfamily)